MSPRRRPGTLVLLMLCALLLPELAAASRPRCRLERVIRLEDRVEAVGGVVELEGDPAEKAAREFTLLANGKAAGLGQKTEPMGRGRGETYVVLAVEISALFAPSLDKIKEALTEFLEALPPRSKVKLISFASEIEEQGAFLPAPSLSGAIDDLNPDDEGEVQLMTAVTAGLRALNKVKDRDRDLRQKDKEAQKRPPPRLLMVVLSDGLNPVMDRRRFRDLGDLLRRSGVPLFPVAFSPRDNRGPLLNLGELAKRSTGTFRWAEKADNLKERFQSLAEELKAGQLLTFSGKRVDKAVPEDLADFAKVTFSLRCGELLSNPFRSGEAPGGPEPGPAWWRYVLGVLGALVGLWALAQGAVFLLRRRERRALAALGPGYPQPPVPGYPPAPVPGYPQPPMTGGYPQAPPAPMTGGYPQAQLTGAQAAARLAEATLIMIGGALGGQRLPVGEGLVIGKGVSGPGALTIADDPTVSSRHCELRRHGAGFALFDLGSTNGTFVNDRRLSAPAALTDGDLVRLGTGTQFKFRLD